MANSFDFKKLNRLILIYAVVQFVLVALLIYMAINFQAGLHGEGRGFRFMHSIIASLVIQVALFYPISKFAGREALIEKDSAEIGITPEKLKALRTKRTIGDVIKVGIFIFFVTFSLRAPADKFIQSLIFFNFILTYLSYFQCFNFAAKRQMKETP